MADKDAAAGWDISVEPFYNAQLPGQSENAFYKTAIDDLLGSISSVKDLAEHPESS